MTDILDKKVPQRAVESSDVYDYMTEAEPVVTTMDVASYFDVAQPTARKRLQELVDAGYVCRRRLHHSTVVWWLPDGPKTTMG